MTTYVIRMTQSKSKHVDVAFILKNYLTTMEKE